jgi:hypothetical protein
MQGVYDVISFCSQKYFNAMYFCSNVLYFDIFYPLYKVVVEKKLMREKNLTRHDLGRENFVSEVSTFPTCDYIYPCLSLFLSDTYFIFYHSIF